MLSLVDWIFIGAGCVFGAFIVTAIVLIRFSFRKPAMQPQMRQEPIMKPPLVAPPPMQEMTYQAHSPWDTSTQYEGFTGIVHIHGVKTGDTFRAVITDNNSKCRLEKLIRVRG